MEMILNKYLLLLVLFTFNQCEIISWEAKLETTNGSLQLVNKFKSTKEVDIIFDRKSFSYVCYYGEDVELDCDMENLIKKLNHNQIILENEDGQRRLYSNVHFDEDEIKELPDENCMYDWYEYLTLNDKTQLIKVDIPYLSDLKVDKSDDKIKMFYIFKPSEEQKKKGYSNLILRSNWITLR